MSNAYNSKDILVLDGLDAVRLRPGMYIGTTGVKGMHHLLWEIVDNGVDELSNGHGNKLTVTMHKDNSITVADNGRGIPVDKHPKLKVSGVEVVFTQLHAGGKFNNSNYHRIFYLYLYFSSIFTYTSIFSHRGEQPRYIPDLSIRTPGMSFRRSDRPRGSAI